jgi:endonuclease-3
MGANRQKITVASEQAKRVVSELARLYAEAKCSLVHSDPLQLLIATILSAQCTDERVNLVTPALFARYPTAADFADADLNELETMVQSTGFFRNKARNIQNCCKALVERFGGAVPATLDELTSLDGVGRKTANVVLGNAFDTPGMVVDTHVHRLSRRLGLTREDTPEKIEQDLMAIVPAEEWVALAHRMIYHGRMVCLARSPACARCTLAEYCPKVGVKQPKQSAQSPRKTARKKRS